ncbi:MAG: hypothetical protein HQL67_01800 [Magnetococcales bacterium]|nr:hypothetical protein [Magnetococcales bacterium]
MDQTTQAELDFPFREIAAALSVSVDELEAAMMTGMVKVEQEVIPPSQEGAWPDRVQLTLTLGEKVVVMPVSLYYPETKESTVG